MGSVPRVTAAVAAGLAALVGTVPALAATSYPDDWFFAAGDQWALTGATSSIQAPAAWCAATGAGITVAMVDTGADFSHPDLQGKLMVGAAFTGDTSSSSSAPTGTTQDSVTDHDGHGTGTTGIVVAATDNGEGIAAVAPGARAMVMNVRGSDGTMYENDVALAMEYAADHGANVINVSLGPEQLSAAGINAPDLTIPQAASYAAQRGVAVVISAGNHASSQAVYPTVGANALVVGALTPSGTMSPYSNHGSDVDIYAPGGSTLDTSQMTPQNSVVTTYATSSGYQYAVAGGTSMSAPMVAGTVALLMQAKHDSAAQAMQDVLNGGVTRNGLLQLDAARALGVADSQRCGTPSTPPPGAAPPIVTTHSTTTTYTQHTTTSAVRTTTTQVQTAAITTTASTTPAVPATGEVAQTPGSDDTKRARQSLPPAVMPAPGGIPTPLVIGGLVVLLGGGAPLARAISARRRRLRR